MCNLVIFYLKCRRISSLKKRLRYSRKPDTAGLFGTALKPLVFSRCLILCNDTKLKGQLAKAPHRRFGNRRWGACAF